jgi:hypothetical protein
LWEEALQKAIVGILCKFAAYLNEPIKGVLSSGG